LPAVSGTQSVGSSNFPLGNIVAISMAGHIMSGNNTFGSGSTFLPTISGTGVGGTVIGSVALPLSGVYASTFIGDVTRLNYIIDGGGSVITSGSAGFIEIPYNATVLEWELLGNISGTMTCDVRRVTYPLFSGSGFAASSSIVASSKPTITAGFRGSGINIGWSGLNMSDIIEFNVDTIPTGTTRATLSLKMQKTS
jgi:hypothetical protein